MKFYEVKRKMNNLQWAHLAFFKKKADAERFLKDIGESYVKTGVKIEDVYGVPTLEIEEKKFSNLKDFDL
jgi:hypothetical protein